MFGSGVNIGNIGRKKTGFSAKDRTTHLHMIGPSGEGKTRLLTHMIRQDILNGNGVCVVDAMGGLYDEIARWCATLGLGRRRKIHLIDPNRVDWVPGFNPIQKYPGEEVAKRVDSMVNACAQVWSEDPNRTPTLKRCLRLLFTALVEHKLTLVEGIDLITKTDNERDTQIRQYLTENIENDYARKLWSMLNDTLKAEKFYEEFMSTNNRLSEFVMSERMVRMFGVGSQSLDLKQCMAEGHIVLVNAQPLKISKTNARLVGALITNELLSIALERTSKEGKKYPFYCYIDEAHRFINEDIEEALDATRQKGLHYILAHQRLAQLDRLGEHIYGAVMGIRCKVIFGDMMDSEAEKLSTEIFRQEFRLDEDIPKMRKPVVVGYTLEWVENESTGEVRSAVVGAGDGSGSGSSEGLGAGVATAMHEDGTALPITHQTENKNSGSSSFSSSSTFWAEGRAASKTEGRSQTYVAKLEDRAGQLYSLNDMIHFGIQRLRGLPPQSVLVKKKREFALQVKVPYVGDSIASDKTLEKFVAKNNAKDPFVHETVRAVELHDDRVLELEVKAQEYAKVADDDDFDKYG